ncbi:MULTISPECIES: stress-induced protein YchH [Photorhabdus]|uniref:stress-induced protein YchH n=1 Tax=Photorhabdus TaxID=29487 RepID=UPI000DCB1656|nr:MULTISPECIES: stress-induced protein YchH [Photorhabdus]MCT8345304.1 stress-induced protein YchH [Photorhabdus kleinii]RAW93764.1 hypothetical protein CKY03_21820 [Photorhabdus sp. S9-53]RAW93779.1 hypothetical protein CKY05_21880 [Photorhabdus sp. S10-54]RAX05365.1 hypothetical protein CKY04_05725 [Photorhabdus sp. S8-52]
MKRQSAFIVGNVLMGVGMFTIVSSLAYTLLPHIFGFGWPEFLSEAALLGVFIGALVWLAGAGVGGREGVADRYWWLRNYDERYRRSSHRYP